MSDEVLVENELTSCGVRRVHVMRMGEAVDPRNWDALVPGCAVDLDVVQTHEEEMDIHHLVVSWNAREVVQELPGAPCKPLVLWWVDTSEERGVSFRWQAELATCQFYLDLGRYPSKVWVRKLPKGAKVFFRVEGMRCGCGINADEPAPTVTLRLEAAEWVPEGFLAVGDGND